MDFINQILGLHTEALTTGQMIVRAVIVFFIALAFIRLAGMRTLGKQSAFDNLTLLMLGAILGRGIVSAQQPFFPSLVAVLILMLLHRIVSWLTYRSHFIGKIFKGGPVLLIENGEWKEKNLKRTQITKEDLKESLHLSINSNDITNIKSAYLERSGEISIIK